MNLKKRQLRKKRDNRRSRKKKSRKLSQLCSGLRLSAFRSQAKSNDTLLRMILPFYIFSILPS
jgi:hypothetical protein